MVLKRDLEEQIKASNKLISDYRYQERTIGERIKKLEGNLESNQWEKNEVNNKFENIRLMMQTIIKILAGDANGESKSAVITDLLSFRVSRAKEELKSRNENRNYNSEEYY